MLARLVLGLLLTLTPLQEKVEVPSRELSVREAPKQKYFLMGPKKAGAPPRAGYGLLVVLPGGNGGRDFHGFVKRIYTQALGNDWVAAQPISVRWREDQKIVWPTAKNRTPGMEFTTEEFVRGVIRDVRRRLKVDPERILLLAWSSGGPAAYAISLQEKKAPRGFYVAMSVFRTPWLPSLAEARGERYFIDHSPDDKVCEFRLAREAEKLLTKQGAKVKLVTYEGGHGWHGDVFGRIRRGLAWLQEGKRGHAPGGKRGHVPNSGEEGLSDGHGCPSMKCGEAK